MKLKFINILFLLGLMAFMGSCSEEELPGQSPMAEGGIAIKVAMPESTSDSRVAYDDQNLKLTWESDDFLAIMEFDNTDACLGISKVPLSSGEGKSKGSFAYVPKPGAAKIQVVYNTPHLVVTDGVITSIDVSNQSQEGNSTAGLKDYLYLASDKLPLSSVADGGMLQLNMLNSILRFDMNNYPVDLGEIRSLSLHLPTKDNSESDQHITLNLKNIPTGKFSAYMSTGKPGINGSLTIDTNSIISLQLIGSKLNMYKTSFKVAKERKLNQGARYVENIDNRFAWKELVVPENEIWLKSETAPTVNSGYVCSATQNDFGYFVIKKEDQSTFTILQRSFGSAGITSIVLPNSITELGKSTFSMLRNLETVVLSQKLAKIGDETFKDCRKLRTINFPESLTEIGSKAFYDTNLVEVVIPKGIKNIGHLAFGNTYAMKSVTILSNTFDPGRNMIFSPRQSSTVLNLNVALKSQVSPGNSWANARWGSIIFINDAGEPVIP